MRERNISVRSINIRQNYPSKKSTVISVKFGVKCNLSASHIYFKIVDERRTWTNRRRWSWRCKRYRSLACCLEATFEIPQEEYINMRDKHDRPKYECRLYIGHWGNFSYSTLYRECSLSFQRRYSPFSYFIYTLYIRVCARVYVYFFLAFTISLVEEKEREKGNEIDEFSSKIEVYVTFCSACFVSFK